MKLSRPSLGGRLTMLNGVGWLVFFLIVPLLPTNPVFDALLVGPFFVLSVPFAIFFLIPTSGHGPTEFGVALTCLAIGANSFAWGYGFAAILKWLNPQLETNTAAPLDTTPVNESAPRIAPAADDDNPYTPPSGG
jgi:hypothetical protein